jgi:hypothetical protein
VAHRGIFAIGDRTLGFFHGIDVRDHDALCTGIQYPRGVVMLLPGHAHDRRDPHRQRGHRDLRRGVEVHRAVLHVDEKPVVTTSLADHRDVDRPGEAQPHADRELAFRELSFRVIGVCAHRGFL